MNLSQSSVRNYLEVRSEEVVTDVREVQEHVERQVNVKITSLEV